MLHPATRLPRLNIYIGKGEMAQDSQTMRFEADYESPCTSDDDGAIPIGMPATPAASTTAASETAPPKKKARAEGEKEEAGSAATGSSEAAEGSLTESKKQRKERNIAQSRAKMLDKPEEHKVGKTWECSWCNEKFYKSEILIKQEDKSMTWQGSLVLICLPCYNLDAESVGGSTPAGAASAGSSEMAAPKGAKQGGAQAGSSELGPVQLPRWKKMCKAAWIEREKEVNTVFQERARVTGWKKAVDQVGPKLEGESNSRLHQRRKKAVANLALTWVRGIAALQTHQRAAVTQAAETFVMEWQKQAENPDYVPLLDSGSVMQHDLAQWVDMVVPGVEEYYICRHRLCHNVCLSREWIHNVAAGGGQYRCPACGEQYRPWREQPGYCTANKIFVTQLLPKEARNALTDNQAAKALKTLADAGQAPISNLSDACERAIYPIIWQDTTTQNFTDACKAACMDIEKELQQKAPDQRLNYIIENLAKHTPIPAYLKYTRLSPHIKSTIDKYNAGGSSAPFSYDHIDGDIGYHAMSLCGNVLLDKPMSQKDLVTVCGLTTYLLKAASVAVDKGLC